MNHKFSMFLRENKSFIVFLILMFVFRSAVADWNTVPTGSMKPTIVEGDRVLINKVAYDLRLPFSTVSLLKVSDPVRGDIIVFESAVSDKRLIKRVIGVPGDTVALVNNELYLNGLRLPYKTLLDNGFSLDRLEGLNSASYIIKVNKSPTLAANFESLTIPDNFYFTLGDNRDNSADSRFIGLVPRGEIIGRSKYVAFSVDYDNFYIPRENRFFHRL